jgi:hypothetical protein
MIPVCPLCNKVIHSSPYLHQVFLNDELTEYVANLVTHYRHEHIRYYNNAYTTNSNYTSKALHGKSWEEFKTIVNNRAKRKLIKALIKKNRTDLIQGFIKLQGNDTQTNELINKTLKINTNVNQAILTDKIA